MNYNNICDIQELMDTIDRLKVNCEQVYDTVCQGTDEFLVMHPDELKNEYRFISDKYSVCLSSAEKLINTDLLMYIDSDLFIDTKLHFEIAYKEYSRDNNPSIDSLCNWQKKFCSLIGEIISFCDFCLKHPYLNALKDRNSYPFNQGSLNQAPMVCVYAAPDMMPKIRSCSDRSYPMNKNNINCSACGYSLNENDKYCTRCGAKQEHPVLNTIYSAPRGPKIR